MDKLNQYAISKALGSKMTPIKHGRFGNFGLLETTVEALRTQTAGHNQTEHFSYDDDRLVAQAFEYVREGASTDAILWDRALAEAFVKRCRHLALEAPAAFLIRRLINIRKNKRRYAQHGITIAPATKSEAHPSIVPQYAHVIEFALVRLRYRYGASIDDILLDPALGEKFEHLASEIAPDLRPQDLRLGALYVRKTRHFEKKTLAKMQALDMAVVENAWSNPVGLAAIDPLEVPATPGLLELRDADRYLYISRNENLRPAVQQLRTGKALDLVANGFWTPCLKRIKLQFATGNRIGGIGIGVWERRLIRDHEPLFNWPVQNAA